MSFPKKIYHKIIRKTSENCIEPSFLNEAVNFEKQCIFIAIPKTGTTSVRTQIKQPGIPLIKNPHLDIVQIRDSLYVFFLKQALGGNKDFPSDSVPSDRDIRLKANQVFDKFFKFSAVRNPWARAVSLYQRREGVKISEKMSFENFLKDHLNASDTCRQPTLHKNQIDWLVDESGILLMDYVYKLEDFSQAVNDIYELTGGRLNLAAQDNNRNPASKSRSYRDMYTDEARKLIAKRFEKDIDHFKFVF